MDNLTHTLVGAALARAGGERVTPLAMGTLVIAANAPDVDVLAFARGPYFALEFRRGLTHGWPALIGLTVLVAGGVLSWDRMVRRRRTPSAPSVRAGPLFLLAALGVASHPLLDWMNTYGMRWSMPFHDAWSYGDALFIVDPWIWLFLGGAVFLTSAPSGRSWLFWGTLAALATAAVLVGPVDPGVRWGWLAGMFAVLLAARSVPREGGAGPRVARLALVVVVAYVGAGVVATAVASSDVRRAALEAGLEGRDILVAPVPGNPFRSEVEIRTPDGYVPGAHRWGARPRVVLRPAEIVPASSAPPKLQPAHMAHIMEAARSDPRVRSYLVWARYPIARVTEGPDGWIVRFGDARYDTRGGGGSLEGVETVVPRAVVPFDSDR